MGWPTWICAAFLGLLPGHRAALAQVRPGWTELLQLPDGRSLGFPAAGVWRARAMRVRGLRTRLRAERNAERLNGAFSGGGASAAAALTGTLAFPTIMISFPGGPTPPYTTAWYDNLMCGIQADGGTPYSLRAFYEELSNGLFSVTGKAYGWIPSVFDRAYHLFGCVGTNPLFCEIGRRRMYEHFIRALRVVDATVDLSQYDNDGPDGVPDSGDDDGDVDLVQFVHPEIGGECGGPGYWAHGWGLSALGGQEFVTHDSSAAGDLIRVDGYLVVSGVGGESCVIATQFMTIGISAHEIGHGLGLPDLYDTDPHDEDNSIGIGDWGLMGSGNYASLSSPVHLSAWSKEVLGWVDVCLWDGARSINLPPVVSSDTVMVFLSESANPRGEYFLLENKQPEGSDRFNLETIGRGGGMLAWHIDWVQIEAAYPTNTVNTGPIHGVSLIQADGLDELADFGRHRDFGDNDDPFPGGTAAHRLSAMTHPGALRLHGDSSFAGFVFDSVFAEQGGDDILLNVVTGALTVVTTNRTSQPLEFTVDGVRYGWFGDVLQHGSRHTVAVPDTAQYSRNGRKRYVFNSWSDGGDVAHEITGDSTGAALVARFRVFNRVGLEIEGHPGRGDVLAYRSESVVTLPGFVAPNTELTLVALPEPGSVFVGWGADIASVDDTLHPVVANPIEVVATFRATLAISNSALAKPLFAVAYSDTLRATGGTGAYTWTSLLLPAWLELTPEGVLRGTPPLPGSYRVGVRLVSGPYAETRSYTLSVDPVPVAATDLADRLLDLDDRLSELQEAFVDAVGNRNGQLDLGDYVLWSKSYGTVAGQP